MLNDALCWQFGDQAIRKSGDSEIRRFCDLPRFTRRCHCVFAGNLLMELVEQGIKHIHEVGDGGFRIALFWRNHAEFAEATVKHRAFHIGNHTSVFDVEGARHCSASHHDKIALMQVVVEENRGKQAIKAVQSLRKQLIVFEDDIAQLIVVDAPKHHQEDFWIMKRLVGKAKPHGSQIREGIAVVFQDQLRFLDILLQKTHRSHHDKMFEAFEMLIDDRWRAIALGRNSASGQVIRGHFLQKLERRIQQSIFLALPFLLFWNA